MPSRTLRALSSGITFFVAVAFGAVLVGDAAFRGAWDVVRTSLPIVLAVLWLLWLILWRPSIRVDEDGARVRNLLRVHDVPWARVQGVVQRLQLVLELDDGTDLECWGAPFPRKPRVVRGRAAVGWVSVRPEGVSEAPREGIAEQLDALRLAARASDAPVRHRWDWVALAPIPVLALVLILSQTLARM